MSTHKCKRGCRGPEGRLGPTGPTGTFNGIIESGSFNPTIDPLEGISEVDTEIGHYIRVNNIVFVTIKGRNMRLNGNPIIRTFLNGLPFTKTTSVQSGEGTATGSDPINPSSGTLSGVCLSDTDFLVCCNMTDTNPEPNKVWTNIGFSFSYVTDD